MDAANLLDWEWIQANKSTAWPRLYCQQLAARAVSHPNDPVISDGRETLSVRELVSRAAGIAERLLEESGDLPVVLLVDRSLASAVALVGVQWSGRCLIPLDVNVPPTTLSGIIDRIGECTVADATGLGREKLGARTIVDVTDVTPGWIDPVALPGDADSLVVFTSGSTGEPKGIVSKGWQDDVANLRRKQDFEEQMRSAVLLPLNWSGGLGVFRASLGEGFALIVDPTSMSAGRLVELLNEHNVDVIHATPSLIETIVQSLDGNERIDSLTLVRMFGEPLQWSTVEAVRKIGGSRASAMSAYGSTEILGVVARNTVGPEEPLFGRALTLGHIDRDFVCLEPFESEESGLFELVIHKWVNDRFWGSPMATNEVFGVDDEGNPTCRTGDLVELDDRGDARFVARSDDVVKISGKLVSPSEATRVLLGCPGVRGAVVLPRTLPSGKKQLVGFVEADAGVDPRSIRGRLVESLPAHLIPGVLVRVDVLPLTGRGKVDRQLLLSVPVVPWRFGVARRPRSNLESIVVGEASKLLGVRGLGVHDDLWEYGLDSLGAIELSEVLARHLSTSLEANDFVGASTPAAISDLLIRNRVTRPSHVIDTGSDRVKPAVFVFAGGGAPFLSVRHVAQRLRTEWHVFVVEQYGLHQGRRPDRTVRAAAERNVAEIKRLQPVGPYSLVGHSWGGLVAHETAVILRQHGDDVGLVLLDTSFPRGSGVDVSNRGAESTPVVRRSWTKRRRMFLHRVGQAIPGYKAAGNRYQKFLRVAERSVRRHRPGVFGAPMLIIDAFGSVASSTWTTEPAVRSLRVQGSHVTILEPPNVTDLATATHTFLDECLKVNSKPAP